MRDQEPGEAAGEAPDGVAEGPGPDARAAQQEEGELVRQALGRLPENYRTVIVLRHYEDMKLAKIADPGNTRRDGELAHGGSAGPVEPDA